MTKKRALITGIFGQDGHYLSKYLQGKGYLVFGLDPVTKKRQPISGVEIIKGSLINKPTIVKVINDLMPDELYNLGSISSVAKSWDNPNDYLAVNTIGVLHLLEAIRIHSPKTRFYQASSSEMFGDVDVSPQTEETAFHPRNPYAISKVAAHYLTMRYREKYNLFTCSGILYNHESPTRPPEFVTRKITLAAAKIKLGQQQLLEIGNPNSRRDWGYAGDYVAAMQLMLQQPQADDYIIATGRLHSVKELVERAFDVAGLPVHWEQDQTHDLDNRSKDCQLIAVTKEGKVVVRVSEKFFRIEDQDTLVGDASKAKRLLGWQPKVSFEELVEMMVKNDLELLNAGKINSG